MPMPYSTFGVRSYVLEGYSDNIIWPSLPDE